MVPSHGNNASSNEKDLDEKNKSGNAVGQHNRRPTLGKWIEEIPKALQKRGFMSHILRVVRIWQGSVEKKDFSDCGDNQT